MFNVSLISFSLIQDENGDKQIFKIDIINANGSYRLGIDLAFTANLFLPQIS